MHFSFQDTVNSEHDNFFWTKQTYNDKCSFLHVLTFLDSTKQINQ